MMKKTRVLSLAVGMVATMALPGMASAQARPTTVNLQVQNASGVAGSATLTDIGGGRTRVEVRVSTGGNTNMPAHIHEGTCATLNPAPRFPLTNVMNGTSTTEVNATISQITASPHAINLHKSPQEASVYVACGNVVAGASALPATGSPANAVGPALALIGAALAGLAGVALRRRS